jgi:nucleotide-binding universal stress UspA family protein
MDHTARPASIIVGIDGSNAAIRAAIWAIDEAVSRDIPLRLVNVIAQHPDASLHSSDLNEDFARAEHIVHQAWTVVEATGDPVKLEMEVLRGEPASMLIQASRSAAMVCVGWTGQPHRELGSTASAVSRSVPCPVAVIRRPAGASLDGRWVIARIDESINSEAVLREAMHEARLRRAPLLALTTTSSRQEELDSDADTELSVRLRLERHLAQLSDAGGDASMCSLSVNDGVLNYLAKNAELAQLVVVGADDPSLVPELTGPHADSVLRHTACSVMSVR